MNKEVICRKARQEDARRIAELLKLHGDYIRPLEKIGADTFELLFRSGGIGKFIVAGMNGKIVGVVHLKKVEGFIREKLGFVSALSKESTRRSPREIRAVVVAPEYRGKIGTRIVRALYKFPGRTSAQKYSTPVIIPRTRNVSGVHLDTKKNFKTRRLPRSLR